MKRNNKRCGFICLSVAVLLSGCAVAYPEMSQEEQAQITEYAAGLLLKYDRNYQNSLLETEELAAALAIREQEEQKVAEAASATETASAGETALDGEAPPTEDISSEESEVIPRTLTEIMAIDGLDFQYVGYETAVDYPTSVAPGEVYFSVSATNGHQLLILKYNVVNNSGAAFYLDMFSPNRSFRIGWNQEDSRNSIITILPDDMTLYSGEIAAGETVSLVLITEIPLELADGVNSVELTVDDGTGAQEVLL